MSEELTEQFKKTPWLNVSANSAEIYCERCMVRLSEITIDNLIEFSKKHEACPQKE
jgi:hypothetical protein